MPTLNPRVNVTLSPSQYSLIEQLASFERVSKSTVLRELLEAAEPSLAHAVALMKAAKGAGAKARQNLATDLNTSLRAIESTTQLVMQNMALQGDLVAQAEEVKGRRPTKTQAARPRLVPPALAERPARAKGSRGSRATPPLIGVVSTRTPVKKHSKSSSRGAIKNG
jgi:hypothetical protein